MTATLDTSDPTTAELYGGEPLPPAPESKEALTAVLRAMRDAQSRISEEEATADAEIAIYEERIAELQREIDRIRGTLSRITAPDQRRYTYLERLAIGFLERLQMADPDVTSVATVQGRVASRRMPAMPMRDDDAAAELLAWAKRHGFTRPPKDPEVDWARLKKTAVVHEESGVVSVAGGVVPGVTVAPASRTFDVELG